MQTPLLWDGFPHVVRSQQFDRQALELIFREAMFMEDLLSRGGANLLKNKILATWFVEPSTRTRWSFEFAMYHLGGRVISSEMAEFSSSMKKGESIGDTAEMILRYRPTFIVMRLREEGLVEKAAERIEKAIAKSGGRIPLAAVVNAGDGPGQHPTQALLDLYTVWRRLGEIGGKHFVAVGDLRYGRTVRSLAYLSAKFDGVRWTFVAPPEVAMRDDVKEYLSRHGVPWREETLLPRALQDADVVYVTRIQRERFPVDAGELYEKLKNIYVMNRAMFAHLPERAIVMHPLPRIDGPESELPEEIDDDPRMIAMRQAENGLYVRGALLKLIADGMKR
ncbi:MAG: aspartate carbamoyltransferase [Parcubacteria group bacterium]|nr:aspartate carbamoyltransferase [Parcubacteria group bacterium]